ncbi:MAG TPA: amidohydrolase [Jatrophihabitans sp.]|uniref:amidohydrolase n=1 Tax=Jatrophihabitans sp. TaxID=1932789 RepID=UPI002DFF2952|nr:amidohydrolase [Jatrophihabitans sp.]
MNVFSPESIDVVAIRRDLHAHPELAFAEHRTTEVIVDRLRASGLSPKVLPSGTGVVCDLGSDGPMIALRADIDALPIADLKDVPYRSTVEDLCHGCGHDAHTAILLGVAHELARQPIDGRVRLIFQPAEETVPGGAFAAVGDGVLDGVEQIYALHCDPRVATGHVGVRVGAITAACDHIEVTLAGSGGHTARPHLTQDLVFAAGQLITDLPGLLSRRVDPRAALSMVWGSVQAGRAANAVPMSGRLRGTLRVFDRDAWDSAGPLVSALVDQIVAPSGVRAHTEYTKGVPPVINAVEAVAVQRQAVVHALGQDALVDTAQSMGGEDFAWYLEEIPGALARLGVRKAGAPAFDLHQGTFDIDEDALMLGVRYSVALAHSALADARADAEE